MSRALRFALLALFLSGPAAAAGVAEFSPEGTQIEVTQARARFSAAMVPVGQPDAAAPFLVDCAVPGAGRWADERTWVYDLHAAPRAGEGCRFRPRPGLATLTGEAVRGATEYTFSIAGPRVVESLPDVGRIDERQAFILRLNGPARRDSVLAHARCEVEGIHESIGVDLVEGATRRELLGALLPEAKDDDAVLVLQCRRTLPANARLSLVWGEGIATPAGRTNPAEQRFAFQVRDLFTVQARCQRESARAGCIPLLPVRLEFSAPVARALLDQVRLRDEQGRAYAPRQPEPAGAFDDRLVFPGPFPAGARLTLTLPADLRDDQGRPLANAARFPMTLRVDQTPPLIKFAGAFGILERGEGGILPLTLRNLEPGPDGAGTAARLRWVRVTDDDAILAWQRRLRQIESPAPARRGKAPPDPRGQRLLDVKVAGVTERALPKPHGAQAFEVVGVPLAQPGYYVLEAESRRLGQSLLGTDRPMYVRAAALVTNLAVHFKWGPQGSLAWVTRLDAGRPVADARVAARDCKGRLLAEATTDRDGIARIASGLPDPRAAEWDCPLYVSARQGDDLAFALSDWDEGIETWRFGLPADWQQDDRLAHTVLDRVLLHPGDMLHMKHLLRERRPDGLGHAKRRPASLLIEHEGSGQRWFLPLAWKDGAALTDWRIPAGARRGDYRLRLLDRAVPEDADPLALEYLPGLDSGRFTVSDFRVPLMRASLDPVRPSLVADLDASYDLAASWLSGGAARGLPVKLRALLEPRYDVRFEAHAGYRFAQRRDTDAGPEEGDSVALEAPSLTLDQGGTGRGRVTGIPARAMPHLLRVELEYADPNGEVQTVGRSQPWWPAAVVLGMKRDGWAKAGQATPLQFLAVDLDGRPAADVPIQVRFTLRQTLSHRVRLAGGFYGYRHEQRDTPLDGGCEGRTDAKGAFACRLRTERGGEILVDAVARDGEGRAARTHESLWVAAKEAWWFAQDDHDRIDLIPERRDYQPGETARLQARMPYRQATALVTVERDGVLEARVMRLSGQAPVIDLKVDERWAPNVYVSALVVRGRSAASRPTALVDLARPSFKLGIAGIRVGHRAHALDVAVATDRASYPVRAKARVGLKVRTPDGQAPPPGTDVALAVVDEGLLELMDNDSWRLLQAMMAERGYNLRTFTAQMQVTGKRHYGRKALPQGGGGGRLPTRELLDTLLYWNPAVALDAHGEAHVEVPLNDSLTGFRVVAVAAGETRFGTGEARFASSQDLQILSGLAPLVRQGDRVSAYFTIRNGSTRPMRVEVEGRLAGAEGRQPAKTLQLAPGEGREIAWPLRVPADAEALEWRVQAGEAGGPARDSLTVSQRVVPALPVRLQSATLHRLDRPLDLRVAPPAGAVPGRGEVRATLAASLADGQGALREQMRAYPYACLEQKVSMAVATRDAAAWARLMEDLPGQLDERGLARFFPGGTAGDVALTAYLLGIADAAGWALPADARARMLKALEDHVAGRLTTAARPWLDARARLALRLAALEALSRHGRAGPELIATVKPEPVLWPAAVLIDWLSLLQRSPGLPDRGRLLEAAQQALKARLAYTGRRLTLGREGDGGDWWRLASADTDAARALLAVLDLPDWKDEAPRLVLGLLARQAGGRWNSTTANAWGALALERYSRVFEKVKPAGRSEAWLGQAGRRVDWRATPRGATAFFPLPAGETTLKLRHDGAGAPWVSVSTLAAVPLQAPVQRGYAVSREVSAVERKTPGKWSRGDVLRVRLTIDSRQDMGWVVVEDPVPAGAGILGSGLKRDAALLAQGEARQGHAWPAWEERLFEGYRAYFEYLPRGRHSLEYTIRLNSDGAFRLPPTRVEAMYAPEVHGEAPNAPFDVAP